MLQGVGATELVVVATVIFFLFGGKKIPEFFKGLGEAVKEFKKAINEHDDDKKEE
jgi:sec-independent protein translocase protein TatA